MAPPQGCVAGLRLPSQLPGILEVTPHKAIKAMGVLGTEKDALAAKTVVSEEGSGSGE